MEPEAASHEEIWDDSVLIDSWNEALEEYKVSRESMVAPRGHPHIDERG